MSAFADKRIRVCGNWTPWQKSPNVNLYVSADGDVQVDGQWNDFCKMNQR